MPPEPVCACVCVCVRVRVEDVTLSLEGRDKAIDFTFGPVLQRSGHILKLCVCVCVCV